MLNVDLRAQGLESLRTGVRVQVDREEGDKLFPAIGNSLEVRAGLLDGQCAPVPLQDEAKSLRGLSLIELARLALRAQGINPEGMHRNEVAQTALKARMPMAQRLAMHGPADFPGILEDVSHKFLRQQYQAAPRTFTAFARRRPAQDFRNINIVQLDSAPALERVPDGASIRYGTIAESKEFYALATYAKIFAITRHTLINDNVDAFTRVPQAMGQAVAQMEGDVFWALITSNVVMNDDSTALFHADHNNLGSTAFGETGLNLARSGMRQQRTKGGQLLNLEPAHLIVPTTLETAARKEITATTPNSTSDVNTFSGQFRNLIVEPRLDLASTTAYYLAASNAQIDTMEYAELDGVEGPMIETQEGFDVDGVKMKVLKDFASAAVEYRGLYQGNS